VDVLRRMLRVGFSPQILLMVSKVYIPVLFPTTFAIAFCATSIDRLLPVHTLFPSPLNWVAAAMSMACGLAIVGMAYTDLVIEGGGSPSPTAGRTQRLVVRGLYAHCRNPSVHGKLLGVLSVGFALNSPSFCFILIPPILAISLVEKVVRQEPQLVAVFGAEYEAYRQNVPLFVPRLSPWRPESS
jgi:protein-S-isoprenylcysteine O-methyltransferase Ste14